MHVSSHIVFNTHLQCSAELTVLVMVWLQCVNIFVKFSLILFWHSFNQWYIKKNPTNKQLWWYGVDNSITETDEHYKEVEDMH